MKPSICFVALKGYAVLSGDPSVRHIGGAEVQQALLARELARRGYRVSFVVLDHGQEDGIEIDGIHLFKAYRPDTGVPGLRFIHPRLTKLWSAMRRADADVYYQRGAEAETGLVANWCRRHGRKFVFAAAHDTNCDPRLPLLRRRSERFLYRYGLASASAVVAQTNQQQSFLFSGFGIAAHVLRSCVRPGYHRVGSRGSRDANSVLWVGRLSPEKRPELLIRVANELPDARFQLVGHANTEDGYARNILVDLENLPNVAWLGYVAHDRMDDVYAQAAVLLCTSKYEGFPNVFLEAWSRGIPVVTTVDPDGVVAAHLLGAVADGVPQMVRSVSTLLRDPEGRIALATTVRGYVLEHHSIGGTTDRFVTILQSILSESVALTTKPVEHIATLRQ